MKKTSQCKFFSKAITASLLSCLLLVGATLVLAGTVFISNDDTDTPETESVYTQRDLNYGVYARRISYDVYAQGGPIRWISYGVFPLSDPSQFDDYLTYNQFAQIMHNLLQYTVNERYTHIAGHLNIRRFEVVSILNQALGLESYEHMHIHSQSSSRNQSDSNNQPGSHSQPVGHNQSDSNSQSDDSHSQPDKEYITLSQLAFVLDSLIQIYIGAQIPPSLAGTTLNKTLVINNTQPGAHLAVFDIHGSGNIVIAPGLNGNILLNNINTTGDIVIAQTTLQAPLLSQTTPQTPHRPEDIIIAQTPRRPEVIISNSSVANLRLYSQANISLIGNSYINNIYLNNPSAINTLLLTETLRHSSAVHRLSATPSASHHSSITPSATPSITHHPSVTINSCGVSLTGSFYTVKNIFADNMICFNGHIANLHTYGNAVFLGQGSAQNIHAAANHFVSIIDPHSPNAEDPYNLADLFNTLDASMQQRFAVLYSDISNLLSRSNINGVTQNFFSTTVQPPSEDAGGPNIQDPDRNPGTVIDNAVVKVWSPQEGFAVQRELLGANTQRPYDIIIDWFSNDILFLGAYFSGDINSYTARITLNAHDAYFFSEHPTITYEVIGDMEVIIIASHVSHDGLTVIIDLAFEALANPNHISFKIDPIVGTFDTVRIFSSYIDGISNNFFRLYFGYTFQTATPLTITSISPFNPQGGYEGYGGYGGHYLTHEGYYLIHISSPQSPGDTGKRLFVQTANSLNPYHYQYIIPVPDIYTQTEPALLLNNSSVSHGDFIETINFPDLDPDNPFFIIFSQSHPSYDTDLFDFIFGNGYMFLSDHDFVFSMQGSMQGSQSQGSPQGFVMPNIDFGWHYVFIGFMNGGFVLVGGVLVG